MRCLLSFFLLLLVSVTSFAECDFEIKEENIKDYNYLILPGFLNEFISFYMTEYRRYLLNKGVPEDQIIRVRLSSFQYPEQGVDRIKKAVSKIKNDKKLIFFSHSKGALELLYFLKDFDLEKLEHAFFIQGPFDGTSSYDVLYKEERQIKHQLFSVFRKLKNLSFFSTRYEKFSRSNVSKKVDKAINTEDLINKVTFVVTETSLDKLPFKMRITGMVYKEFYGEVGDGVLLKSNQIPKKLDHGKSCVLEKEGSHDTFVKAAPWQTQRIAKIHNFLDSILFSLGGQSGLLNDMSVAPDSTF